MKFLRSMILWATVLTLSGVLGVVPLVLAQDEELTTAKDVVEAGYSKEAVKKFVESARDYFAGLNPAQLFTLGDLLREEGGDWNYASMYLIVLTDDGTVFLHGEDPSKDNRDIKGEVDANGKMVVQIIVDSLIEDDQDEVFVEYTSDDPTNAHLNPRNCYALKGGHPALPGRVFILVGGYHHNVTSMTDDSEDLPALDFAHFANGEGITSDIVVVNASANAVQPDIYFYDSRGVLIDARSVVDVTGQSLKVTSDGALTVPNAIPPLGEVTIPSHGMGNLMIGSVKVVSDSSGSSIGGVLRFDLPGIGVAGVGASQPVRDAIFPARRMADGINTGAAFRNLSESGQKLTCRLMKDGQQLGGDSMVDLPANGQTAKFINEMFDHDTSDFTGSVRCTSPAGEQEFTGVALELDASNGVFTTLPVVPVVARGSGNRNQATLYFAHFANGGGITSDIVVVNASANATRPDIYFYDTKGVLIDARSVVDITGQSLKVTSDGALTVPNSIPPLGEVTIPTHGMGDLTTGSVKVVSDSSGRSIGGVLRFDLPGVGVAGVGASQPVRDAIFPARRMVGGINTGAAFRNLSESNQILTCWLMKGGQQLGDEAMVDLPANGQTAKFINEMFDHDTSDFTGSVRCTSPAGEQEFTAVALELDPNNGVFTTLPMIPIVDVEDSTPVDPLPKPLTVTLSASPTSILPGGRATLMWSSTNAASATITPGIGSVPTSGSRTVSPSATTTYRITVQDSSGRTATAAATVTVTAPADLVVDSLTVSASMLKAGQSFDLRATVRNQGGSRSGATTLRYYRSSDATISTGDTSVGTDAVGALDVSNTSNESIRLTAPSSAGTFYYGACVDSVSGETVIDNNCSQSVPVTVGSSAGGKMYWTDVGKIQRANLDGSGVEDLVTLTPTGGVFLPNGLALDLGRGQMYWTDQRIIQRANLDGSGVEALVFFTTGVSSPNGIALDLGSGQMYWTNASADKIQRANLDGSGVEDLVTITGFSSLEGIALDLVRGQMYWADLRKIQRANLDGSGVEDLVTGVERPYGLALDLTAGKMYWTDWSSSKIQRANLDGSGVEDLVTGVERPYGLALDLNTGKMYWTDGERNKIQRSNFDGSGVEDLVSGLDDPKGLALELHE